MSKKRDPILAIISYFTTADLAQADVALTVAREILRTRHPRPVAKPAPKKKAAPPPRQSTPVGELAPV